MATETVGTDRGVGFAVLFTLLGLAGALVALISGLTHHQIAAAWGFAAAIFAGSLVVVAIHLAG